MKTNNIFRKVGGILAEINEQYQYLSESPENLNELELELLSANADFLAEHIKVLKKLNFTQEAASSKTEVKTSDENISETPQYKESLHADADSRAEVDDLIKQEFPESNTAFNKPIEHELPEVFEPEETESATETEENPAEVIKTPAAETTVPESAEDKPVFNSFFTPEPVPVNNPVQTKVEKVSEPENPVVNEVVIEEKVVHVEAPAPVEEPKAVPTLNELMSSQRQQTSTLGQFAKPQQVTDLKSIISLNDKLLFIKDLFNGYSLAYSEAIEIINRFDSFDAADNFLKTNYSVKNNWAAKEATADKFYQLLNRRFSV
ncbi:MAG: hypothetical protein ACO1N7_06715 [Sphingobacteriaceae bacterium]